MQVARDGLRRRISGSGERPEVDVRIRVFIGLTKQPKGAPMLAKLSQKDWRSMRGIQKETLST
jgi:hypothetical protein